MGTVQQRRNLGSAYPIYWMWGGGYPTNLYGYGFQPTQQTESYRSAGDAGDDMELGSSQPQADNGHEFFTTKTSVHYSHPYRVLYGGTWEGTSGTAKSTFRGPVIPSAPSWDILPVAPRISINDLRLYGTRAINATIPTKPKAGLMQFLAELREGLPHLIGGDILKTRAKSARSLGSEYLNVRFGWIPLVSDVRKVAQAVANHAAYLRQLERDSGRVVRRRFRFADEVTSSFLENVHDLSTYGNIVGPTGSLGIGHYVPGLEHQPISQETTTVVQTWFSGAYQYFLPQDSTLMGKLELFEAKANHLLGLRLTPEVLWELAPWSWLADWYGTVGVSIENADLLSSDNLVLRYGYLMRQTTYQRTYRCADPGHIDRGLKNVSVTLRRVTKERRRATPYGFGLDTSSLSANQWAILGALGLTKAPRALR